jgi:hypothetical protein
MAASFAVFSLAVLIWATPSGRVVERVELKQLSPGTFTTVNACRDDLENKVTSRLAQSARNTALAVTGSPHAGNASDHLVRIREVVTCLPVPAPSADVLDGLTE